MNKRLKIWVAVAMSVLVLMLGAAIVGIAQGASPDPVLSIDYSNLSFRDAVYLKYAVKAENADASAVKLKVWSEEDYLAGNGPTAVLSSVATEEINGQDYLIFDYKDLAAKQMTDNVYAEAYVEIDGTTYSSEVNKNSILQYAYDKLGKTGVASTNENFKTFLTDMLQYGASAQKYFDYKADRPANADFYQVKPVGGTLPDGFTHGLYLTGDSVTITAPETNAEGIPFSHWADAEGNPIADTASCSVEVGTQNTTYTAVYETVASYSDSFVFTSNGDGTCSINVIDPTPKSETEKVHIDIPPVSPNGDIVTAINDLSVSGSGNVPRMILEEDYDKIDAVLQEKVEAGEMKEFDYNKYFRSLYISNDPAKATSESARQQMIDTYPITAISPIYVLSSDVRPNDYEMISEYLLFWVDYDMYDAFADYNHMVQVAKASELCTPTMLSKLTTPYGRENVNVTSITIPEGVTSIGAVAFSGCSNLTSITIPSSVTSIGDYAFSGCYRLIEVCNASSLPITAGSGNYGSVGSYALHVYAPSEGTSKLDITEDGYVFYVDTDKTYLVAYQGTDTELILPSDYNGNTYEINKYAFYYCRTMTSIAIPSGVTSISSYAFEYCIKLTSVHITDLAAWCNISFGDYTANPLYYAHNLYLNGELVTDLIIPEGVTSIDSYAFSSCSSLTSITIPSSVTSIGSSAFEYCSSLTSITIPEGVTSIDSYAFSSCSSLTSITIPSSVTSIGDSAFYRCSDPTSVYITDLAAWCNISFGDSDANPLYYAHNLYLNGELVTDLIIPEGVTSIDSYAFSSCSSLTSITIPSSVTSIGSSAFEYCSSLTSITIPEGVTSIGNYAFEDCSSLTSITIPSSVTSIGDGAFSRCVRLVEICNASSLPIVVGSHDYGNVGLYALRVYTPSEGTSKLLVTEDGYVFYADTDKTYLVAYRGTDTDLTLPSDYNGNTYEINKSAFSGCSRLTSITIPDTVTGIGDNAFSGCSSLTSVHITDLAAWCNISFGRFDSNIATSNPLSYAQNLYLNGELVTDLIIPEGVTSIGDYAFSGCSSLTSITIPEGVTSIGNGAFSYCRRLTSITIPDSVTSISYEAFSYCSSLTSIMIPDSVTRISTNAFSGCYKLIQTENGVSYVDKWAIDYSWGTSVSLRNNTVGIGDSAFSRMSSLTSITIPGSVKSIGSSAFDYCSSLTSVHITDLAAWCKISFDDSDANPLYCAHNLYLNGELVTDLVIPEGVTSISNYAFYNCTSLTSITIPDTVTSIGDYAFYGCTGITSITIPFVEVLSSSGIPKNSLKFVTITGGTQIGDGAFSGCSDLTSIIIPDSVTSIGDGAFSGCSNLIYNEYNNGKYLGNANNLYVCLVDVIDTTVTAFTIPETTKIIYGSAFSYCPNLTSIVIPEGVTSIGSSAFAYCSSLTSITIPDGVTSIGDYAFYYCSSLTSITIPDSVTSIGYSAFSGCSQLIQKENGVSYVDKWVIDCDTSVTSLSLRNDTVGIGDSAFAYCSSLTSITIPEGVTSIGDSAFAYCSSLTSITFAEGSRLTSIGRSAFEGCSNLTSIVIPEGVTSIGNYAFYRCSNLISIMIPDSVISIGFYAFYGCDNLTIYAEAASKPSGWAYNWNPSNCPVVWGYKREV